MKIKKTNLKMMCFIISVFMLLSMAIFTVEATTNLENENLLIIDDGSGTISYVFCTHNNYSVIGKYPTYHSIRCNVCTATEDRPHSSKTKCDAEACTTCGYGLGSSPHYTSIQTTCTDDYGEKHAYCCQNKWGPYYIQCTYKTGETSCSATGNIWYGGVSNGVHRKYQACGSCGIGVFRGTVPCYKTTGNPTCPYC